MRAVKRDRTVTIYLIGLLIFMVLAFAAHKYSYFSWDLVTTRELQSVHLTGFRRLMRVLSLPGDGWIPYGIVVLNVVAFLCLHLRLEAACLTLSSAGGEIVNRLLKMAIARPRPSAQQVLVPDQLSTLSFPSGHVTFYVCYFGFLFFVAHLILPQESIRRRLILGLIVIPVALIGLSRVYLGAHWPSDVLGAYLIGSLWLAFSLEVYQRWKLHTEVLNNRRHVSIKTNAIESGEDKKTLR